MVGRALCISADLPRDLMNNAHFLCLCRISRQCLCLNLNAGWEQRTADSLCLPIGAVIETGPAAHPTG